MEDDLEMTLSIWEMTVSIWSSWISIWDILSLCVRPLWSDGDEEELLYEEVMLILVPQAERQDIPFRYCHLPDRYCHLKVVFHIDTVICHIDAAIIGSSSMSILSIPSSCHRVDRVTRSYLVTLAAGRAGDGAPAARAGRRLSGGGERNRLQTQTVPQGGARGRAVHS